MNNLPYIPEILDNLSYINFDLYPKSTLRDIKLISYIFDKHEQNRKENLELCLDDLKKLMLTQDNKEILKFIRAILGKKILFTIFKDNIEYIYGEFRILNSFALRANSIFLSLSKEIIDSLDQKGFFYKYHLKNIIKLKNKKSITFYKLIIFKLLLEKEFTISLKNLKSILDIDKESYSRFFDFEKNILKPILNEFNFIDDFDIFYEKIKSGSNKTNKILGLKFTIQEKSVRDKEEVLREIIEIIKNDTKDFKKTFNFVSKSIDFYGSDYVLKNIKISKKLPKENFDIFLKEAFENNYAEMSIHNIYNSNFLIFDKEKKFLKISDFQNLIYEYMTSKNLYYSFNISFLTALKNIKNKNNIWFCDKNYKIIGLFQENDISFVKIFKL